jgi:hypothetical protein
MAKNGVRTGGEPFYLKLAISYTTADAEVLYTVPTGLTIGMLMAGAWEVTTAFTGGTSSAIGISSNAAGFNTKGDIHGGATGDLAASLTAGIRRGTTGAKVSAAPNMIVLPGGSTIRFDRIASAFTAGAGFVHLPFVVVA